MADYEIRKKELSDKYGIDFDKLEKEQIELAKELVISDKIDSELFDKFGGVDITFIKNKILCCFIVCDKDYEVIDRSYVFEKIRFPYYPGFRNYRELPSIIDAFEKLNEKPDVVFISGHGLTHPRLGLASHFGLSTGVPAIGVSNSLVESDIMDGKEIDGNSIMRNDKKIGMVLTTKPGSRPMYISPGNFITLKSAYDVSKRLINLPHKKPEPLHLAGKYGREVKKELLQ